MRTIKPKAIKPIEILPVIEYGELVLSKKYPGLPSDWRAGMAFSYIENKWVPKNGETQFELNKEAVDSEFFTKTILSIDGFKIGDQVIAGENIVATITGFNRTKTTTITVKINGRIYNYSPKNLKKIVKHWFISSRGIVQSELDYKTDAVALNWRKKTNNYFTTKEAAVAELNRIVNS